MPYRGRVKLILAAPCIVLAAPHIMSATLPIVLVNINFKIFPSVSIFYGGKIKFSALNCLKNNFRTIKILFFSLIFRNYKGEWVGQTKPGKLQIFFEPFPSFKGLSKLYYKCHKKIFIWLINFDFTNFE